MICAAKHLIIVRPSRHTHTVVKSIVNLITIWLLFCTFVSIFAFSPPAEAAVSSNLNFQARLTSNTGAVVPDGNYHIEFKLYNASSSSGSSQGSCTGDANCLWTETRTTGNLVRTVNGYLTVNLGSVTAFPSTINWDQEHWITMNIGGTSGPTWDGEMNPRLKLTAVPYAFQAGQADTITNGSGTLGANDLLHKAPLALQSLSSTVAGLRFNQTSTGGLIQLQGDSADVFTVSKTGAVTAGTYNTNTFTGTALTFGGAGATTIQAAANQGLTVQSQGTGVLTLTSGSGTVVLGSNTLQNTSAAMTLDVNNAGLSTFSIVNNNGSNLANLDVEGGLFAGNANAFSVNSDGDITSVFTTLNGSSTTNGAAVVASTSMTLTNASNFDVGNYIKLDNNGAGCSGSVTVCYAKITAKATNVLTITPALTWSTGRTVTEMHIPEVGGLDTSQTLENRYGRGYFIAGVATGNGTTYYNEDGVESSLAGFDLLNTGVTSLNIGGAATTINLGGAGTTLLLPGTVDIAGSSLDIGTATQQGSLILQNGSAKTGTIQVGTLAANRTYTLPDVDGTICLTTTCTGGGGPGDAFVKDGNTFGVLSVLGTNDAFGLAFETSAVQRVLIDAGGNVGIGTSGAPSQLLSIGGTTGNLTVSSSGSLVATDITSNGALSILAGGASITGGLNNNNGGITNAGNITGVGTNITATAGLTIASGGTSDLTLSSASGLIALTAGTLQTIDNLAFDLAKATDTTLTLQNSGTGIVNLNLLDGGLNTGGTQRITNAGVLQNITGLTVISGGASITGNITLGGSSSDRISLTGQLGGASPIVFQGATDDGFATTLGIQDPTANNTITLPNASGTLVLDSRSITTAAGSGLTGGGNLSVDRSLSLDINGITTTTAIANDDYVAIYDSSATGIRKISRSDFLQGVIGALIYQGTWDASTNTPTLSDATGTNGYMYAVSVAGTENFGGGPPISFGVGDFVIHNGTDWEKAPSASSVASVFGRTGTVTAQNGDYTGLQITNTPSGTIAATTVQAAIDELAAEKLGSLNGLTAITQTFVNDTNVTVTSSGSTHTFGWAGQLSVARGGTGTNTFTTNGVLYGNGTSALQVSAAGTSGQVLLANASGVPTFTSLSGDITVSSTGVTTIGANTINLTTDTAGNYVASIGTVTGLTLGGTNGVEGAIPTLSVNYGSLANTAVQGNTGITVTAGTNLSGGGAITLGAGGTVTLNTIPNPTFATSVTAPLLTSTGDLTLDSGTNKIIIAGTDTTMERTAAGSYTIDLKDNAATALVLSNSSPGGSSFANLNLADGVLQIAGTTVIGNDRSLQNLAGITNIGVFTTSGGVASINDASNFATNINTGTSTGTITLGGGTAPLTINSTAFDVTSAGALSGITTINASGLATISGGATISGAIINLNASSNFAVNIGTGTSTGTITLGGGTAPLTINSTAFDVTSAGALSGITTLSMSGAITAATAANTINGLIINAGALTGVAGVTFSSGNTITSVNNANLTLNAQGTGNLVFTGYDCSTQSNGGALTTNASGVVACSADDSGISDSRLKKNILNINDSILNKIKDVRTVTFDFDCDQQYFQGQVLDCRTDRQTGIIAQELEQIFPELVYDGEDGYKRVDFKSLNFYNLKAVSELAAILSTNGDSRLNNVSTGGTLRISSTGSLQNITGFSVVSGGGSLVGGLNNNAGGISNTGAILGATTITAESIIINATPTENLLTLKKDNSGVFTILNSGALEMRLSADNAFNIKNTNGQDYFSINTNGGLVRLGSATSDDMAVLLVLDSKNTVGDPQGVNGAQYYNEASHKFRCYQNDQWQDCLQSANSEYVLVPQQQSWNMPSADTEFLGQPRTWVDLTNAREFRMTIRLTTPGSAAADCRLQYALSDDGLWKNLDGQTGPELSLGTAGTLKTIWATIVPEAREEVLVRVSCKEGTSGARPEFYGIKMQLR